LKDTEWIKSYEIKGKISGLETLVITEAWSSLKGMKERKNLRHFRENINKEQWY
jgi:hypothetical protein